MMNGLTSVYLIAVICYRVSDRKHLRKSVMLR